MQKCKGAAYVVLMLSLKTSFGSQMASEGPFNLQSASEWAKRPACVSSIRHWRCGWGRGMKQKEHGILKLVRWNKIVCCGSNCAHFWCFWDIWCLLIQLPGRHWLSQCGRQVFRMKTLPSQHPVPSAPSSAPVLYRSLIPGVQGW